VFFLKKEVELTFHKMTDLYPAFVVVRRMLQAAHKPQLLERAPAMCKRDILCGRLIDGEVFRDGPHPQSDFDTWIKATEGPSPCWHEAMHFAR
jgi:hypothetical protein